MRMLVLCAMVLGVCAGGVTHACTCGSPEFDVSDAFKTYDMIFIGRVVGLRLTEEEMDEPIPGRIEVLFRVRELWKGDATETITIYVPGHAGICSPGFKFGRGYIVFAAERNGDLHTSMCDYNAETRSSRGKSRREALGEPLERL